MIRSLFPTADRVDFAPRDYQVRDHDESFRLWNAGHVGVLTRSATGTGKTLMSCTKAETWLARGEQQRVMIISYERQLVWQIAQEIEDFLGITPGIEMESQCVECDPDLMPKIIVASRQTLMPAKPPTPEQLAEIVSYGIRIEDVGAASTRHVKSFIESLADGDDVDLVRERILTLNRAPEACGKTWSRLHKFDWRLNWLVIYDEAHKHAYHLRSVAPIVDWFERNPEHRRSGVTATPKRGDAVSLGDKMFPQIAIDYPLYSPIKPCAIKDGWAVPYIQKYIEVEGVDFKSLPKLGIDFDEEAIGRLIGEETMLAKIVGPLLEMVGDRRTLIFSPTVEVAKDVARFINARCEVTCSCGRVQWHPKLLIGDGAKCSECGRILQQSSITKDGIQAMELDGAVPEKERRRTYAAHQAGAFRFLSVCGLCREGYNDPDISCVAIFRPVSEKASSLAEQMKGRGCRPLRGLLEGLITKDERLAAIAASAKPNCLIVDLVGVTGLADCASTVAIYAEGLADEVAGRHELSPEEAGAAAIEIAERAKEILAARTHGEPMAVEDAISQALSEDDAARDKVLRERREAERKAAERAQARAKAGAEVKFTQHEMGHGSNVDPDAATPKQYRYMAFLGMDVHCLFSRRKAGRIINMLKMRTPLSEIARLNGLHDDQWAPQTPSPKQIALMQRRGVPTANAKSPNDASLLLDAKLNEDKYVADRTAAIKSARSNEDLTAVGLDLRLVAGILPYALYSRVAEAGRARRAAFDTSSDGNAE